jgi:exodeoxyribonuclease V alpha subunit
LTELFRQADNSQIVRAAHQINQGLLPDLVSTGAADFRFIPCETPEAVSRQLIELVTKELSSMPGIQPRRDVQVLSPMNRGSLGAQELNRVLQAALNPPREPDESVEKFGWKYRVGDKVIQMQNNYDKDVFNGDIGIIQSIDGGERQLKVQFDQREVIYEFGELDELALAYAITIHKSQGSEFPVVIIPLATQHYMLLQRNLIYTGITRGKRLVYLIGQKKALEIAVRNNLAPRRYSGLEHRLRNPES